MSLRRVATMGAIVALTVVSGASLPGSSAYLNGSSGAPSSFGVGEFGEEGSLIEVALGALCGARGQQECPAPPAAEFVPPWLAPSAPVALAPQPEPTETAAPEETASPEPSGTPAPRPSLLPVAEERCEEPGCVEEAVHVVGVFAEDLRGLREQDPGTVPEDAVRTISAFAEDLERQPAEDDVELPADTVGALQELVDAGVMEAFTPECVTTVGQLADLISRRQAAAEAGEPSPEPSPAASCTPDGRRADATAGPSAEPSPQPDPSPQAEPQPGTEPEPAPSGEPTEYPYDGPGHRVRSA